MIKRLQAAFGILLFVCIGTSLCFAASKPKSLSYCPIFQKVYPAIKRESGAVPIRLPVSHCKQYFGKGMYASVQPVDRLGYDVVVSSVPGCNGAAACYLYDFTGTKGHYTPDPDDKELSIPLANGIKGSVLRQIDDSNPVTWTDDVSGTGYGPTLTWQDGPYYYSISIKGNYHSLIPIVNDIIRQEHRP